MKFSKYNNPQRRRKSSSSYSSNYVAERKKELYELLANAKTDTEREMLIKAFNVSVNP